MSEQGWQFRAPEVGVIRLTTGNVALKRLPVEIG
jgi:hypothetical protein